jgi:integrase
MRTPGTGSVYKRKNRPGWTAQVVVGFRDSGTPIYKRKTYPTKREAILGLEELRSKADEKPVPTVAYYYEVFCKGRGAAISKDKQTGYRIAYNRLKPYHSTPVNELTVAGIQEIINTSCKTFYPAKDLRGLVRHILRRAGADGVPVNLTLPDLLELPSLVEEKREPFTEEEQIALWLSYEEGNVSAGVPLVMIYTGLMTGEMRKLEARMIDFESQEIKGVGLKTDERHEKSVLIPDDIIPILEDMVSRCPTGRFFPMSEEHFYDMYYAALTDAGITRHLTPYSCRTTTATTLAVHREVAPQIVQRVMRWKSTKVMDKYVKPDDSDARKALNKI